MRDPEPLEGDLWRRRDFLARTGWFGIISTGAMSAGGFLRLLFRRAPIEPATVFQAGRVQDYAPRRVSSRWVRDWRVFIVRDDSRLYAVHARCTHLGCTPRWWAREDKFKCACHGSGFHADGVNFEGPAPRPLERAKVWLDERGDLVVDVGLRFPRERWDDPLAFVDVEKAT